MTIKSNESHSLGLSFLQHTVFSAVLLICSLFSASIFADSAPNKKETTEEKSWVFTCECPKIPKDADEKEKLSFEFWELSQSTWTPKQVDPAVNVKRPARLHDAIALEPESSEVRDTLTESLGPDWAVFWVEEKTKDNGSLVGTLLLTVPKLNTKDNTYTYTAKGFLFVHKDLKNAKKSLPSFIYSDGPGKISFCHGAKQVSKQADKKKN